MTRVVSIHSFRGGTGKSNTTANLSCMIARRGHRVGIVDTDIQSPGIHVLFGLDEQKVHRALNDYLWDRCPIEEAAYDVTPMPDRSAARSGSPSPAIFVVPSSIKSAEIARVVREGYDISRLNDGIRELAEKLRLDFVMIDTHPGVNEETLLSIAMSDILVLVLRPDQQDYLGTAVTVDLARRLDVRSMVMRYCSYCLRSGSDMDFTLISLYPQVVYPKASIDANAAARSCPALRGQQGDMRGGYEKRSSQTAASGIR